MRTNPLRLQLILVFIACLALGAPGLASSAGTAEDQSLADQQRYQEEVSGQDSLIREKYVELARRAFNSELPQGLGSQGDVPKLNLWS